MRRASICCGPRDAKARLITALEAVPNGHSANRVVVDPEWNGTLVEGAAHSVPWLATLLDRLAPAEVMAGAMVTAVEK